MNTSTTRRFRRHGWRPLLLLTAAAGLLLPVLARSEEPAAKASTGEAAGAEGGEGKKSEAAATGKGGGEVASSSSAAGEPVPTEPPPGGGYTLAGKSSPGEGGAEPRGGGGASHGLAPAGTCPICPVTNKDEVKVLLALRERHTLLSARENLVAQKEAALVKLEESLDAQLTRFDVAIGKMEGRLEVGEAKLAKRDGQVKALVQTLQGLSAKKAAPMLAEAQPDLVAEIFRQLGPTRVASLLTVMPPAKAGKLIDLSVDKHSPLKPHPRTSKPAPGATPAADGAAGAPAANPGAK